MYNLGVESRIGGMTEYSLNNICSPSGNGLLVPFSGRDRGIHILTGSFSENGIGFSFHS